MAGKGSVETLVVIRPGTNLTDPKAWEQTLNDGHKRNGTTACRGGKTSPYLSPGYRDHMTLMVGSIVVACRTNGGSAEKCNLDGEDRQQTIVIFESLAKFHENVHVVDQNKLGPKVCVKAPDGAEVQFNEDTKTGFFLTALSEAAAYDSQIYWTDKILTKLGKEAGIPDNQIKDFINNPLIFIKNPAYKDKLGPMKKALMIVVNQRGFAEEGRSKALGEAKLLYGLYKIGIGYKQFKDELKTAQDKQDKNIIRKWQNNLKPYGININESSSKSTVVPATMEDIHKMRAELGMPDANQFKQIEFVENNFPPDTVKVLRQYL